MFRIYVAICTILFSSVLPALAGREVSFWTSIPGDSDAYEEMMERAAFLDVPRRDLLSVVKGYPDAISSGRKRQQLARSCFWKSWVLFREDPDSSAVLSERALQLCDSAAYPYDHLRFSIMRADILRTRGNFAEAYAIYRDKLSQLQKYGDRFWQGKVYVAIGTLMQELGEFHEAMRNFREGESFFKNAGSDACVTKNRINIANLLYMLGHKEEALSVLDKFDDNPYVQADSIYLANVLVSKFAISDNTDSMAALRALDISRRVSNDALSVLTMTTVGLLRAAQGDATRGIALLDSALVVAERIGDIASLRTILQGLDEGYRALGYPERAGVFHQRWRVISDSLYTHERIDRVRRAEHLATINRYERRMAEEQESSRWRMRLILLVGAALLIIAALLLRLMWMWRRRADTERRLKEEENERLKLLNRQYSMEIEAKEKELASNTLLMSQKNTQLKDLARQIEEMEENMESGQADSLKEVISRQLSADDDWRYFQLRFEKVHPGFFDIMRQRYPSLSRTDLRLCAYIRVGMTAKEIAQVLSVKPDTVNTSRYRIRKKMNLPPDASLEAIIASISL